MEKKTSIMKQLNKKAHPDGFMNFKFVISKVGEHDYNTSQLCIQDVWESIKIKYTVRLMRH